MGALTTRWTRFGPIVAALGLCSLGCDFFRPQTPEPPSSIQQSYAHPYSSLDTIADAVAAKGPVGQDAYIGAFANSTRDGVAFQTVFDPADVERYKSSSGRQVPTWNLDLERAFYADFVDRFQESYLLRWTPIGGDDIDPQAGEATLTRKYEVFTTTQDGSIIKLIAVGFADLQFRFTGSSRWVITLWLDRVDPTADPNEPEQRTLGTHRLESQ